MPNKSEARRLFNKIVSRREEEIELARATLLFAKEEYPDPDFEKYLRKLELMAEKVKSRIRQNTLVRPRNLTKV